ncbi:hypothetical protein D187_004196 [Cystobacter fuscus DSM 2262]|uniref:Uncharacterized protein n=1 Tax=Cystobacter fuscus (strain ATCC 25194 / DSM 2262 / NBRC 100088 / M29) TaxID=1242864 RepID=S9QA09_CYSF2|nr:hypothetical protein D187_004196 [Cystobacter fuscus DSM 2262]
MFPLEERRYAARAGKYDWEWKYLGRTHSPYRDAGERYPR